MITCTFDNGDKGNLRHVCIDALIVEGNKILLGKRSMKLDTAPGKYCIPGGYLDRGETTLEGVKREIKEETGFQVEDGVLFHIRDYPDDLDDHNHQNIAFTYLFQNPKQIKSSQLDWDSDKPSWFDLKDIDTIKDDLAFDHWHIIRSYIEYLKVPGQLPIWNAVQRFKK
jgi:8-oxo-dGTP pyrophosphatase MutT (NUDIX family)